MHVFDHLSRGAYAAYKQLGGNKELLRFKDSEEILEEVDNLVTDRVDFYISLLQLEEEEEFINA